MKKPKKIQLLDFLDCGIFPPTIMFSVGLSYEEVIEILKKKNAEDWVSGINQDKQLFNNCNYLSGKRIVVNSSGKEKILFFIFIKGQFLFTDYEYCKLAHEILHICQFSLPDILDRDKEHEAEAYLHTHLMNQCLKLIRG